MRSLLLILFLVQIKSGYAFFSQTYDFGELNIVYSSSIVYESDTTAIAYSTCRDGNTATLNIFRIHLITKQILINKKYDFTPEKIQGSYYLFLIKSKYFEGYYAAFNIADTSLKNTQTIFFKLNTQLDTILTFRTDTSVVVAGNTILEGTDSCIYFVGGHYYANKSDSCQTTLYKFDSNGNKLFQKFFNIPFIYDFGISMDFDSKRNIYLSSITNFFSVKLNRLIQHPIIFKLNNNGELINLKDFGMKDTDECGWDIHILNDTIFAGGCNTERFIKVVDTNLQMCNKFSVIGTGDSLKNVGFLSFQFNQTGNIIMIATAEKPYLKYPDGKYIKIRMGGYIGKMNRHNGEILWERVFNSIPDTVGVNYISGINITPKNEILLIGTGLKSGDPKDYKELVSILYLDSNGCVSDTICGEWSRVPINSSISNNLHSGYKIYPNPITNYFHINNETPYHEATYQIINMQGQIILEGKMETVDTKIETDNWLSGVYILRIQRNDGTFTERILKE